MIQEIAPERHLINEIAPERAFQRMEQVELARGFAEALNMFYENISESEREQLKSKVVEYPYGSRIMDAGVACWPNGEKIDGEFLVANDLPFGIILENCVEVSEQLIGFSELRFGCQALLGPGRSIGLFEVLDWFLNGVEISQDWTLNAGSTDIHPIITTDKKTQYNQINKIYGNVDRSFFRPGLSFAECAISIDEIKKETDNWKVEILYLNRKWFEILFSKYEKKELNNVMIPVVEEMLKSAWTSVSDIRVSNTSTYKYFHPDNQTKDSIIDATNSYMFLSYIVDAVENRRPVYSPEQKNSNVAPCETLSRMFLSHLTDKNNLLMRPCYFKDSEDFYLPLGIILPSWLGSGRKINSSLKEAISDIARTIGTAYNRAENDGGVPKELDIMNDILSTLVFRTPGTLANKGGYDVFGFSSSSGKSFKLVEVSESEFLCGDIPEIEMKKNLFLKNCLKSSRSSIIKQVN